MKKYFLTSDKNIIGEILHIQPSETSCYAIVRHIFNNNRYIAIGEEKGFILNDCVFADTIEELEKIVIFQ